MDKLQRFRIALTTDLTLLTNKVFLQLGFVLSPDFNVPGLGPVDVVIFVGYVMTVADTSLAFLTMGVAPALELVLPGKHDGIFGRSAFGAGSHKTG